ncbi:RNA-binding protein 12B-like [Salmo trutta]|uniref:RNA binding motif protein 12Bb n=1 Tax=Salmo trutta TaxID=8032 RepID=A0A674BVD8_SALTR|nr:RNA-binding protein 12B-like [Salmo trutta]XP_029602510.1 RNA-binding protein 12B-like [Salmo trutta]XP_029602511.1 RNA-binding protein 12B-like [Salmo trutta]XP_029602512.1 RNA-binding protein 12B-like [Salmo trutta]
MAVVIHLQGLRITAGSEDVRNFFTGLKIPDGGVHIIGGESEEAFIIFASDEDARRAMTRSEGSIKGSPVRLRLSSKSEMQAVLKQSIKPEVTKKRPYKEGSRRPEREGRNEESRRKERVEMGSRSVSYSNVCSPARKPSSQPSSQDELYLYMQDMPFTTTEEEVRRFFEGLVVEDIVMMRNNRGQQNGKGVVKFESRRDAREGLKRHRQYLGTRFVKVYASSEKQWVKAGGAREPPDRARSYSPVADRSTKSNSPANEEFCVLVENLPYLVEKRDIKEIFRHADLKYDQILHLLDKYGSETRSAFVLFRSLREYGAALTLHKQKFLKRIVYISPISKEKMVAMLESGGNLMDGAPPSKRSYRRSQERLPRETKKDVYESDKICLYVRNLPLDVRKVEIVDFFLGFRISEETVVLLLDHEGNGLGEALVIFQTEEEAMRAQSLNGQGFLGTNVILKCISLAQMREFGVGEPAVREQQMERSSERYLARSSEAMSHLDTDYRVNPDIGHLPMNDLQVHIHAGSSLGLDSHMMENPVLLDNRGNGSAHRHGGYGPSAPQQFDDPTTLTLVNLPWTIRIEEIYNFFYGYRVIPGSVSLQYDNGGRPKGSATIIFESHLEALMAVEELSGRPIGSKKVSLLLV